MAPVVADIGAAFVLLVAGGCARAIAQPLWRRFVHWWHTEGNEPVEFRWMDRLVESMAAKPRGWHHCRARNMWVQWCSSQKVCTDCGQRLPKHGEDEEGFFAEPDYVFRQKMYEEHVGTKNAGKVPMWTAGLDRETVEEVLRKEREAAEEVRKAKEELLGDDDEVWMMIAMQSGASRSEAQERVERFHAMRKNAPIHYVKR